MAQNITLMGASYTDVPAVTLPKTGGGTARFDDVSVTTATAADVASGKVFVAANGAITQGTNSGGGGGETSWTKIAEAEYQVSTTETSAQDVATLETGNADIFGGGKWIYVRIRDTAGKRKGYFYGSDNFFLKSPNSTGTTHTNGMRMALTVPATGNNIAAYGTGSTGIGVYADRISSKGDIRIRSKYVSGRTVDSTYKVEVFILDLPGGILPFGE